MMTELIFAQAALLAGQLEERQLELLKILCRTAESGLERRLQDGLTPEDCKVDFVTAASLLALAALQEAGQGGKIEELRAGDLTIRRNGMDPSSRCLQRQAEMIMQPFLKDGFSFRGV